MVIANLHELVDDVIGRRATIDKEQVVMSNIFVSEESLVVFLFVQSDDPLDAELLEDLDVLVRMVAIPLVLVPLLDGAHERHELSRNNPVEIAILNSLVLLILFDVEGLEFVPPELDGILETLEALKKRTLVEAVTLGGVSVGLEQRVVRFQSLISLLGGTLEDDDHETAHQESSIDHLVWLLRGAVVEDTIILVVLVAEQPCELSSIPMDHCKIQWTEVLVERHICEVVIDIEEKGILEVLRRLVV